MRPRGILNISHLSCHLNCALQILFLGIQPLTNALIEIGKTKKGSPFLVRLGTIISEFTTSTDDMTAPFDPCELYRMFKDVDPYDVGDTVNALRNILAAMRSSATSSLAFKDFLDHLLGGSMRQQIIGVKSSTRRQKSKDQTLPCPLSIAAGASSLQEGLKRATTRPTPINDFDWEKTTNPYELHDTNTVDDVGSATQSDFWKTYKIIQLEVVPPYLLIHLERFKFQSQFELSVMTEVLDIPLKLDIREFLLDSETAQNCCYTLKGAILYVIDSSGTDATEDFGHYVSLICTEEDEWYLIDDECVMTVQESDVSGLVSGEKSLGTRKGSRYFAVLVLYCRDNTDLSMEMETFSSILSQEPILPEYSKIGKRVQVQWAKGKWYSGIISEYCIVNGKHTVVYDDGDVKSYNLAKKKIIWED